MPRKYTGRKVDITQLGVTMAEGQQPAAPKEPSKIYQYYKQKQDEIAMDPATKGLHKSRQLQDLQRQMQTEVIGTGRELPQVVLSDQDRQEIDQLYNEISANIQQYEPEIREDVQFFQEQQRQEKAMGRYGLAGGMVAETAAAPFLPGGAVGRGVIGEAVFGAGEEMAQMAYQAKTGFDPEETRRRMGEIRGMPSVDEFFTAVQASQDPVGKIPGYLQTQDDTEYFNKYRNLPEDLKQTLFNTTPGVTGNMERMANAAYVLWGDQAPQKLLTAVEDQTGMTFAQRAAVNTAFEVLMPVAGKAISRGVAYPVKKGVAKAVMKEAGQVVSEEAVEAAARRGIDIPYILKYQPTRKGERYIKWSTIDPESPLRKSFVDTTKKLGVAQVEDFTGMMRAINAAAVEGKRASAMNAARKISETVSKETADNMAIMIKASTSGLSETSIDDVMARLIENGKSVATATAKNIDDAIDAALTRQTEILSPAQKAQQINKIIQEGSEGFRELNESLYSQLYEKAGTDLVDIADVNIDDIISKYYKGQGQIVSKAKGAAVNKLIDDLGQMAAPEYMAGWSPDAIQSVLRQLNEGKGLNFEQLKELRTEFSRLMPASNAKQRAMISEISNKLGEKLDNFAKEKGFYKELKQADDTYKRYRDIVDSKIYKKISTDEAMTASYAPALLRNKGEYDMVADLARKAGKKRKLDEILTSQMAEEFAGGKAPRETFSLYNESVQQALGPEYIKFRDTIESIQKNAQDQIQRNQNYQAVMDQMAKEFDNIEGISDQSRQALRNLHSNIMSVSGGPRIANPEAMTRAIDKELLKAKTGDSVLASVIGTDGLRNLRDFSEGASTALGLRTGAVTGAMDPQKRMEGLIQYYTFTGKVGPLATVLGTAAAFTPYKKNLLKAIVDPKNAKLLKAGKFTKTSANAVKRIIIETYIDNDQTMPKEEEEALDEILKVINNIE